MYSFHALLIYVFGARPDKVWLLRFLLTLLYFLHVAFNSNEKLKTFFFFIFEEWPNYEKKLPFHIIPWCCNDF